MQDLGEWGIAVILKLAAAMMPIQNQTDGKGAHKNAQSVGEFLNPMATETTVVTHMTPQASLKVPASWN
jgi:hypothetical protein